MFTWICPQCGREVPPSYTECPDCKARAQQAPPEAQAPPPVPPPQQGAPPQGPYPLPPPPPGHYPPPYQGGPPQQYPPQQYPPPQYAQQQYPPYPPQYAPRPRGMQLPIWLMTILFALAIGGAVGGIYWLMQSTPASRESAGKGPTPTPAVESPAAKAGAKINPLQKYIEVSGVRFTQDAKKKTLAKFLVVNHSGAEISGLAGNVTVWGRTQKSEEEAQGTFTFTTNLGPFESKEVSAPLNSKRRIYELPDWQNITTDVQITAPGGA